MSYLLAAGIFAGVFVFLMFITNLVKRLDTVEHFERIERIRNGLPVVSKKQKVFNFLISKINSFLGPKKYENIKKRLVQAGMEDISAEKIIFLSFVSSILMLISGYSAGSNMYGPVAGVLIALLGSFLGFNLINIFLTSRIDQRNAKLQASILPVVELFAIAVETGLTIQKAIETVSETFECELTAEFKRFINESKKFNQKKAFENLLERCGHIDDIRLLIESLQQSIQTGGSLISTLYDQVARIRTSVKLKATTDSQKLALKILFPSIIFQLPAFILILFVPAIINMYESFKSL